MADNFNMKQFLMENKLGSYSRNTVKEELEEAKAVSKEDKIQVVKEFIWYTFDEGQDKANINKFNKMVDIYFADKNDVTKKDFEKIWAKTAEVAGAGDYGADWEGFEQTWDDVEKGILNHPDKVYEETQIEEARTYKFGDMWSQNFDYLGMLRTALEVNPRTDIKELQALSDSFEDVNYHRENSHLQAMIDAIKAGNMEDAWMHTGEFRGEVVKTLDRAKNIKEEDKIEEGEAAYEYEKGKAAGEKEEKEKLKETLSGEAYARMDGLVPQNSLSDFRDSAYYIVSTLKEDGFDDEDIIDYLTDHIKTVFD